MSACRRGRKLALGAAQDAMTHTVHVIRRSLLSIDRLRKLARGRGTFRIPCESSHDGVHANSESACGARRSISSFTIPNWHRITAGDDRAVRSEVDPVAAVRNEHWGQSAALKVTLRENDCGRSIRIASAK